MFFTKILASCIVAFSCLNSWAMLPQATTPAEDAARDKANDLMSERAERVINAKNIEKELQGAWGDERYSSPEIVELRQEYRKHLQKLNELQITLQKKVKDLPQYKEKADKLNKERAKIDELHKEANKHFKRPNL